MADPKLLCPSCGADITHEVLRDTRPDSASDLYTTTVECDQCLVSLGLTVDYEYRLTALPPEADRAR